MLALERRNLILEKLQDEKRVVVSELSQLYSVSAVSYTHLLSFLQESAESVREPAIRRHWLTRQQISARRLRTS